MAPSRWPVILITTFCAALGLFYGFTQIQPTPIISLGLAALPFLACAWWVQRDARARRVPFAQDWGLFAWIGWPLLVPWYAWRTRAKKGWRLAMGLYLAILAPYIMAFVGVWLAFVTDA